jgi:hypothetical protein
MKPEFHLWMLKPKEQSKQWIHTHSSNKPKSLSKFCLPVSSTHRHVGLILIFLGDPVGDCACVHGAARLEVYLFPNVASATFTGNTIDALCHMLRISFGSRLHAWTPKIVFSFEDRPDVSIPYTFELLRNTLHIWDIHRAQRLLLFIQTTATLGINEWVDKTLEITAELKITSH